MADGDVDIYGDLYADVSASVKPAASAPPKAVASAPSRSPPAMSPPTRSPPRQTAPILSYEAYEAPSPRMESVGTAPNGFFANKVWVAPGLTASPAKVREPRPVAPEEPGSYDKHLVVEAGEVVSSSSGRGLARANYDPSEKSHLAGAVGSDAPRPGSFEELQQEMLAEEQPAPPSPGAKTVSSKSPAREDDGEETEPSDDDLIVLGEVRASETGAKPAPRTWPQRPPPSVQFSDFGQGSDRREVSLYIGPPQPTPHGAGTCDCFALVGGLPWWLSDAELRRHAEQFGQIRGIRILDFPRSGKSTGIALLEYIAPDSARRAAQPREGMSSLPVWGTMSIAPPRIILVSRELFQMLRAGPLPWPDGGPCQEDLRSIMMRQFGQEHVPPSRERSRGRHHTQRDGFRGNSPRAHRRRPEEIPRLERQPSGRSERQQSACVGSPEPEKAAPREQVGWADKLKKLSGNVNKRPEVDMESLARKVNRRC